MNGKERMKRMLGEWLGKLVRACRRIGLAVRKLLAGWRARPRKLHRVVVLERIGERQWKTLEAELDGEHIRVLEAQASESADETLDLRTLPTASRPGKDVRVVLVSNSDRAICRLLDLPPVSPEQTQRMAALRLEMELPYPFTEATWVSKRQKSEDETPAGNVLVIATPTAELTEGQAQLRRAGWRCQTVEFDAAALTELALASGSPAETIAVAAVGRYVTTLAISHAGELRYVRRIFSNLEGSQSGKGNAAESRELANELVQSILDYTLHTDNRGLEHMLVVGEGARGGAFLEELSSRLGIRLERGGLPENVHMADAGVLPGELLEKFPACLGALIASQRRLLREATVAPPLWRRRAVLREGRQCLQVALVAANVLLIVSLGAASFSVRRAKLAAATRIIDETRELVPDFERLKEEVQILESESQRQRSMLDVLLALAEALPKGIGLKSVKVDSKGKVDISGKTPSVEVASEKAIKAIEDSPMLTNPKWLGSTQEQGGISFTITCELRKSPGGSKP